MISALKTFSTQAKQMEGAHTNKAALTVHLLGVTLGVTANVVHNLSSVISFGPEKTYRKSIVFTLQKYP
jgi:hypothetical protein